MLATIAAVITVIAGFVATAWYILDFRKRRVPTVEREERIKFLQPRLEKMRSERKNFDSIRSGKHLEPGLRDSTRWSLLGITFDNIRERVEAIGNQRRYRRLSKKIIGLIHARNYGDPSSTVAKLDPLLQKFEWKVEKEIRSLLR